MTQDALEQSTLTAFGLPQLALAPHDEVHLTTDVVGDRIVELRESVPVHVTNEQHVDVAGDVVGSRSERSKDQAEPDATHVSESIRKQLRHTTLSTHEPADRSDSVAFGIERPHSQVSHAPARNSTCLQEVIERQLRGVRIGIDTPCDFTRVNLEPWRADEEVEHPPGRRTTPKKL